MDYPSLRLRGGEGSGNEIGVTSTINIETIWDATDITMFFGIVIMS